MFKTDQIYSIETIAGLFALTQGIIGVILGDKIKNRALVRALKKSSQIAMILYPVLFIIRLIMYVSLHQSLSEIEETPVKGFGSFFAEYVEDTTGSIILASILLSGMLMFYFLNFWTVKLMNKMLDFQTSVRENQIISQSILVNSHAQEAQYRDSVRQTL